MKRLIILVALLVVFTGGAALAQEPDPAQTQGSSEGTWQNGREWRYQNTNVGLGCPEWYRPTVAIKVARTEASSKTTYSDVDHSLIQAEFRKPGGGGVVNKEKIVGWYPSLHGEFKFPVNSTYNKFRHLKLIHSYTGDAPFNKMQLQGPYGGSLRKVWSAVSFNYSVEDNMWVVLRFKTEWSCKP